MVNNQLTVEGWGVIFHPKKGTRVALPAKGFVMPVYEFECPEGTITERLVKMGTKSIKCPQCHKTAHKIISRCTFELKGGGWYADGYRSTKSPKP